MGGESSHCVLSGHRGLPGAKLFTNLDQLTEGEVFMIRVLDDVLSYEVDQILIVESQETGALRIEEGKDYCTLATCTPYGINTSRLLVRGHRIGTAEEAQTVRVTAGTIQIEPLLVASAVAIPILMLLIVLLLPKRTKKKKGGDAYEDEKITGTVLAALLLFALLPVHALAAGRIDMGRAVGLTVSYR